MLVLKQDGGKVTGTFTSPHGDVPLAGEYVGTTLTFHATIEDPHHAELTFTGTRKDDGTLAGAVTGPMGDMTWKAERAK